MTTANTDFFKYIADNTSNSVYSFMKKFDPNSPLQLIAAGRENCTENYQIDRENFPFIGLEFITRGKILYRNKKEPEQVIFPGTLLFYNSERHFIKNLNKNTVKYFIDISGTEASKKIIEIFGKDKTIYQTNRLSELENDFETLIRYNTNEYSEQLRLSLTNSLLLKISETGFLPEKPLSESEKTFKYCKQLIKQNFKSLSELSETAELCGINKHYLCRLFSKYSDSTPYEYLYSLKIKDAADLIRSSDLQIKEIAYKTGFKDNYHFSRAFKRILGISPSDIRNTIK